MGASNYAKLNAYFHMRTANNALMREKRFVAYARRSIHCHSMDPHKSIERKSNSIRIHTTRSDHRASETVGDHHTEDEQETRIADAELKIEVDHFAYFLVLGFRFREQQIVEEVKEELAEAQQLHRVGDERRLDHIVDKEGTVIDRKQALNGVR